MVEMTENMVRLRLVPGLGSATIWKLLRHFGDSDRILGAPERELAAVEGVGREKAKLVLRASSVDPRPELEKAVAAGIVVIPYDDPSYPAILRHMFDPPVILYVRGTLKPEDQLAVGVVGTRNASKYGREQAAYFSSSLSRAGFTIVSGLARGVDTAAHIGALDAGGRTIGVLGCGFDHMYPAENRDLALEMSNSGAVVSELCMAVPPSRETFPARNRIIAGLALGLLVIEAPPKSGALITARQANELGRTVFAVPGRIGDASQEGCNSLIRDGAVMVTRLDDILEELNPSLPVRPPPARGKRPRRAERAKAPSGDAVDHAPPAGTGGEAGEKAPAAERGLGTAEAAVMKSLSGEWLSADDVIASSGLSPGEATAALGMLRLKRRVEQGPGQMYRLK